MELAVAPSCLMTFSAGEMSLLYFSVLVEELMLMTVYIERMQVLYA